MPFRDQYSESKIDEWARLAFLFGHSDPSEEVEGPGVLLRRIMGPGGIVPIDIGTPGTAKLETAHVHDGPTGVAPYCVRIPANQSPEQLTMSAAYGCALYVAWARLCMFGDVETWDETRVRAVALAIAMPIDAIVPMMRAGVSLVDIADRFAVDSGTAAERMRMIVSVAKHDSGERPACEAHCTSGVHGVARAVWDETSAEEAEAAGTRRRSRSPSR